MAQRVRAWGCYRGYNEENVEPAQGLGRTAIERQLLEFSQAVFVDETIDDSGWWNGQPRESDIQAVERAALVAQRLTAAYRNNETVVLVTHADFKRLLLARLLESFVDAARLGPLRNTGVTRVNYQDGVWQLDFFNSVSHLPARLITGKEH